MLINDSYILKLSDFGVGHSIDSSDNLRYVRKSQTLKPPEAHLDKDYSGKAADFWLCGATLYHMIQKSAYKPSEG